jgi:SulP family sulfate permease
MTATTTTTKVTHTPAEKPSFIRSVIPILAWLPKYKRSWLTKDIIAGSTLAAFSIPESMAYAGIAGLPAEMGLYTSMWLAFVYTLFGTSSRLAAGPTSGLSATMAAGLVAFANTGSDDYIAFAALTTIVMGLVAVVSWALRLGFVVNFISKPVLIGFSAGAAFYITGTQLGDLFGIDGGDGGFFSQVGYIIQNISETNMIALTLGIVTIIILLVADRVAPKLPNSLIVVLVAIGFVSLLGLQDSVDTVGSIPQGLPSIGLPKLGLSSVLEVLPLAISLFLLGVGEHIGIARSFGNKYKEKTDANQEMLAIGLGNIISGIGGGYVGAGSMSRSTVNDQAGAQTWVAGAVRGLGILLVLLFLFWLFANLAMAVLAGIVIVAVIGLVDIPEIKRVYALNKREFFVLATTFIIVVGIGLLEGLVVGMFFGLVDMLGRVSSPHTAILGRYPGTDRVANVKRVSDAVEIPGILIYRIDAALFYANAADIQDEIGDLVDGTEPPVKLVIMDLGVTPILDITGADTIGDIANLLASKGVALKVANATNSVRQTMLDDGLEAYVAPEIPLDQDEVNVAQEWLAAVVAAQASDEAVADEDTIAEKPAAEDADAAPVVESIDANDDTPGEEKEA